VTDTSETAETFCCPACGVTGLSAAELRDEEVAGPLTELSQDECDAILTAHGVPAEYIGRGLVHAGGRLVHVSRKCLYCAAQN